MIGMAAVRAAGTTLLEIEWAGRTPLVVNALPAGLLFRFHDVIARIADRFGVDVAREWTAALVKYQGTIHMQQLESAIASGNLQVVDSVVNAHAMQSVIERAMRDPIMRATQAGGTAAAAALVAQGIDASFNAVHPNVIMWARNHAAEMVTSVPDDVKEAIRLVIAYGAAGKADIGDQARMIREVVGLPRNWVLAPLRFGDELRQAAFDGKLGTLTRRLSGADMVRVRAAVEGGTATPEFIAEMQAVYSQRLINLRATTIARTESLTAANKGVHMEWQQAVADGTLPQEVKRFWIVTPDDVLCDICVEIPDMNPDGVGVDEPFDTPDGPVDDPPAPHPNCRCATGLVMPDGTSEDVPAAEIPTPDEEGISPADAVPFVPEDAVDPYAVLPEDADILAQTEDAYPPLDPITPPAQYPELPAGSGLVETAQLFRGLDGTWTPERQALHDAITRHYLQGLKGVETPQVHMLGGGPAAGKSVLVNKLTLVNTANVDPDEIKTLFPEWKTGRAANNMLIGSILHEESSVLAKAIVRDALAERYNMVVQGTGDNAYENLVKKVEGYRAAGTRLIADYVTVDTETAIVRAAERGAVHGRNVPEAYTRSIHRNVSVIFPKAIENGLFDEAHLWDTNGAAPLEVVSAKGSKITVLDEGAWQRFLAKAQEDNKLLEDAFPRLEGRRVNVGLGGPNFRLPRGEGADLVHDYLGAYGQEWKNAELPAGVAKAPPKECYANATALVLAHPEYRYVEGIAYADGTGGLPFWHAWAVTPEGHVVDPTWAYSAGNRYFGVAYDNAEYLKYVRDHEFYGVLGGDREAALKEIQTGAYKIRWVGSPELQAKWEAPRQLELITPVTPDVATSPLPEFAPRVPREGRTPISVVPQVWEKIPEEERALIQDVRIHWSKHAKLTSSRGILSDGIYESMYRTISAPTRAPWSVIAHETGHAVDHALGSRGQFFSETPKFRAAVLSGLGYSTAGEPLTSPGLLQSYYTRVLTTAYERAKWPHEVFADMYASLRTGAKVRGGLVGKQELKRRFPEAWRMMVERLANLGIPTVTEGGPEITI